MTQIQTLEKLIRRKRGVTSMEIISFCRTVCPGRRLADLKQRGWTILSKQVEGKNYHRYFGTPPKGQQ